MSNKLNIFNSLPQYPSDDEEDNQRGAKKTTQGGKAPAQKKAAAPVQKEDHSKAKETRKEKGVTAQPHPQDRHSGHGNQAYGGKPKKGGAGKGNWGKTTEGETAVEERAEGEEATEQPAEEEKPSLTLQEYYEQQKFAQDNQEVNEAKAKITSDQLLKELGKATALKSKNQEKNDDHRVGKKKGHLDINHHAGLATEHGDLLGFRTGFVEKEYRQRKEGEEGGKPEFRPRREGERGERRERREPREEGKQEETPAQPTAEGEQAAPTEQAGEGQERRREGGNRGGQRGDRGGQRGDRGGYRGDRGGNQGPRKPYTPKVDQAKINVTDDSAFPKLG